MSISIFTITHVPFTPPADPIYIPLQVGRASQEDHGYPGDDTGDNISRKNQYYSELTGLYWIWKNYTEADYLGLCHYRRYFLNNNGNLMSESDYMDLLSRYDVIIAESISGDYDYRTVYGNSHDIRNLDLTGEVIQELYPDYYPVFQEVITGNTCYVGNLFVAPKTLFHAYSQWLFSIFFALEPRIDFSGYDDYHKRVFGFLSEQLLMVWIRHNDLSCYEAPFGLSQEKAETIVLKQHIKTYLLDEDIFGAYQCLCGTLDKRPDLLLEMSDFNQELTTIEHILNLCRIDREAGLPTLLQFSKNVDVLIRHFRLLLNILEKIRGCTASEEETAYLLDCGISYKSIVYMIQNFTQFSDRPLELLNRLAVIYADNRLFLTALSFLEEALSICETDRATLSNIIFILQSMGEEDMAEEYRQLLYSAAPKRIALFTGHSISVLTYIAEQYAAAFESLGHTVFRFDMRSFDTSFESLLSFRHYGLDAAVVFNNACFQMRMQSGDSLWDLWNVPCYNIIVDHPMHYFETLDHAPLHGVGACADRYHRDYIKRFNPAVKRTVFLPTAGVCLKPFKQLRPFAERSIDVLFIGTFKYQDITSYQEFELSLTQDMLTGHTSANFETLVEQHLLARHSALTDSKLKEIIQEFRSVDVNACGLCRAKIIEVLLRAGITVTVYGRRWECFALCDHPNFIYKGGCSMEEGIALMEDSKIVLNQLANFKDGASERIFEAMLQGAISLTDDSIYLREMFEDSTDIKFYSLSHLEALPDIIHSILSNPALSEKIRRNAYRKAAAQHTWIQRASTLLSDLSLQESV